MEVKRICHFEKFGKCNRQNCQFHHPEEICCDKTCQIQFCLKKHPLDCRYFWVYNACKNENSCKFRHKMTDIKHSDIYDKKIETLENEVKSLKNINKSQEETNSIIKLQLKQQGEEIVKLQSQLLKILESSNGSNEINLNNVTMASDDDDNMQIDTKDALSKSAGKEVVKKKLKRLSFQGKLPQAKQLLKDKTVDVSVDESKFQRILMKEHKYASDLEKEVKDISDNLKGRLIDETTKKLQDLKEKLKSKMIEMKQETTHDNEETYMMIENFINMVEKLKNTPKNKFRKVAEKDLELILEEIETICQIKEFELNDNESFKKNEK